MDEAVKNHASTNVENEWERETGRGSNCLGRCR